MSYLFLVISLIPFKALAIGTESTGALIQPGNETGASLEQLQKRVWTLEHAVLQLQEQLHKQNQAQATEAAVTPAPSAEPESKGWTCEITMNGKTYSATERTKLLASIHAQKRCTSYTNVCGETQVRCQPAK